MDNVYIVEGKKLKLFKTEILFDFEIDYCVQMDDKVIVLLSIPISSKYNENVFCVSLTEQKVMWQIEKRSYKLEPYTSLDCKYSDISVYDNKLRLNNWCDAFIIVDPLTGNVLEEGTTR